MQARAVAVMPGKAVLRVFLIVFGHYFVAGDFSYYRRGGYRQAFRIATDNAFDGTPGNKFHPAVYDYVVGQDLQVGDGHLHSSQSGLVDIYLVDRLLADHPDADYRALKYLFVSLFALLFGEFFRIVYLAGKIEALQDDGAGYNRTGKRPPPGFIDTRYNGVAAVT